MRLAEIRANMAQSVPGTSTGLEVYYKFDETGGNTVVDYASAERADALSGKGASWMHPTVPLPFRSASIA